MDERIGADSGFSGILRDEKIQNFPATLISSELSTHQKAPDEKVQNLPAKLISSELRAHQMAPRCAGASALEPMGAGSSADPLPRIPDSLLLYWTLVDQSVVPPGFEEAFASFSVEWSEAAARDDSRKSHWNNETAALSPAAQRKAQEENERLERHSKDQFLLAAIKPPSAYRTKFHKIAYEGATARKAAEEDERLRWLHILAGIVQNTETPMATILRERSGDIRLLGAGKRATTLRARVTSLRRHVVWLSAAHDLSFPAEVFHLVGYLQARAQEPATRGGLKAAHQAMRVFEEITAIPEQGRLTDSAVYVLAKKEMLAAALPGNFPKQAPRFPTGVLAALEEVVSDQSVLVDSGPVLGNFAIL